MRLVTRNGHNMYDMSSMLQKAIRRGLVRYASYAAYELYGDYYEYVWKRLLIISAEDCYGIMTKEIIALKLADDEVNKMKTGYGRNPVFLAKAVVLLCMARKNRDACYVSCNFMQADRTMTEMELQKIGHINLKELQELRIEESKLPNWVFDVKTMKGKESGKEIVDSIEAEEDALTPHQYSMFDFGDWSEYLEKKEQTGEKVENFKRKRRKSQKEKNVEENFKKL